MIKLKINNSRVMDSIETAHITVTSPTGKTIYLYKAKLSHASEEQKEAFWKFCNDPMIRFIGEMEATGEEMVLLLEFSKIR